MQKGYLHRMIRGGLLLLIFGCLGLSARQVVDNPRLPKNPEAGRVLVLEEVLRIRDTGGKYYFGSPIDVFVDSEGRIYYQEMGKLLVFDSAGGYVTALGVKEDPVSYDSIRRNRKALDTGFTFSIYGFWSRKGVGLLTGPYRVD